MKHIALLIGLFWTATAFANCKSSGLYMFPIGPSIQQNSIFILTGYANSQDVILGLNTKYPIYLMSGTIKVKLLVSETCVGDFHLTQAILKPETTLEADREYKLYIDSLPFLEPVIKYNKTTATSEPVSYKVVSGKDTAKPLFLFKPKILKKTLVYYGCGPSIHVVFSHSSKDTSELVVKTTVINIKTGKETTFYIEPEGDKIKVGHGMCLGAFNFEDGENYEIAFSLMDASGNITEWTGERLKFSKPNKQTDSKDE